MSFDAYIQIQGIKGDCTDEKHKDWIEVTSYSLGFTQAGTGSASSAGALIGGKPTIADFSFAKRLDIASPNLMLYTVKGTNIPKIVLECCRSLGNKVCFYKLTFENTHLTSYIPTGSAGGDYPAESVSFVYDKLTVEYTQTNPETGEPGEQFKSNWSTVKNATF